MRLKYPAEAFALGMILFSAGMKEAFAAGILVILAVVFGEFDKKPSGTCNTGLEPETLRVHQYRFP